MSSASIAVADATRLTGMSLNPSTAVRHRRPPIIDPSCGRSAVVSCNGELNTTALYDERNRVVRTGTGSARDQADALSAAGRILVNVATRTVLGG
jgi:hypothetical protein